MASIAGPQPGARNLKWPLLISFIRLPILGLLAFALALAAGGPITFPPLVGMSALYFIVGNVICFFILKGIVHREGASLSRLLGFSRERLGHDILWGLLWVMVLYVPFAAGLLGTLLLVFGGHVFSRMGDLFAPAAAAVRALSFGGSLFLAVVTAILFPVTNAPVEELYYRGYAQPRISAGTGRSWLGILIPALGFSLQHLLLAPTAATMVPFASGFFAWGVGAGIIYRRQQRLMPLVLAHFITNLAAVVPAVMLLFPGH